MAENNGWTVDYDRNALVAVLVYHWPTNTSGCICGWNVLGASWPGHIADVYEMKMQNGWEHQNA